MLALGNFKSGVSTPKDSLWQKVHVSLRGLSAICNKIQLKDAYNNKDIISSHMKSKVGSFSGSLSKGVGPFRLSADFVFRLNRSHQVEVTILNISANMMVSTSRNMITSQLCPFMNQQNSGLLPTKAYLLHISLSQDCFMHPCLKSWQRKQDNCEWLRPTSKQPWGWAFFKHTLQPLQENGSAPRKEGVCVETLDVGWATTSVCNSPEGKFNEARMC